MKPSSKAAETATITKPPYNTRWIMRRADLPPQRHEAKFEVLRKDADPFVVTLTKRQRQVVEALRQSPIYCASPVRLSDVVHIVKREYGLNIETLFFSDPTDPEVGQFGVYVLRDQLVRLSEEVAQ